ncbi:helix-turn-helix domain-containing protein [Chitinophaga pinensis]|uniref:helix-turn-helix domain-containing protein n=1 Tax=Chitinophaga pinensis TaxID=79329 RepID=UPI0039656AC8
MDKAKELLKDKTYSLTEIAYLTGFSDQSHFTRIFRKLEGETPSQHRKNLFKGKNGSKS